MSRAPSATRALQILRFLATQPRPVPAEHIAQAVGLPRASAYRLLTAMADEGFVVHLPEEQTFGLGVAAFEVGTGYVRQAPLERLSRLPLAQLVDEVGESAHLAVLHGRDVLYVLEERAPGRPPLVTDVGVRLPAHLTASGRAMLAALPAAQVRALFPNRAAFVQREEHRAPSRSTPTSPSLLRAVLSDTRRRGYGFEYGEVSAGFASVASAVLDHTGHPAAAVAVTFAAGSAGAAGATGASAARSARSTAEPTGGAPKRLAQHVRAVAEELSRRLHGRRTR